MSKIETVAEREETIERCAVARCICRTGRYPEPVQVREELRNMRADYTRGLPVYPTVNTMDAGAFLTGLGLTPPKREVEKDKARPGNTGNKEAPAYDPKSLIPNGGKLAKR